MSRKNRTIDVVAGLALLGMVTVSALAQVGPPQPHRHYCPGGTAIINGVSYTYGGIWCDDDEDCGITVNYNTETGEVDSVSPTCLSAA